MSGEAAGRRVLITGASRGIGRAIARELLRDGAHVAALVRDKAHLATLAAEARALSAGEGGAAGQLTALTADLMTSEPESLVAASVAAVGGVDVLVNCAGVVEYAGVGEITPAALARQLQVNFSAPLLLAQAAAARMIVQGTGGAIVSIASTLGLSPAALTTAYAASKAALISATRSLALELATHRIRVNAIAPGVIETDMVRVVRLRPGEPPPPDTEVPGRIEAQLAELRALHPLGRLGQPSDVVDALRYLLASPWVTGTVMAVDGGLSLS